jgi:uncharacterized protein (TIGR02217 family)
MERNAMAEFIEERLSLCVRIGGGTGFEEEFSVELVTDANGSEYRRLLNPLAKRRYELGYLSTVNDFGATVLSLYRRTYGPFAGFRLRDPDDFNTSATGNTATAATDQAAPEIGATNTFQLSKEYPGAIVLGIGAPVRTIFKPVAASLSVEFDSVPVVETTDYTVDYTTGILTPVSLTPTLVTWGGEFDIPVRFEQAIQVEYTTDVIRTLGAVSVIELLNP